MYSSDDAVAAARFLRSRMYRPVEFSTDESYFAFSENPSTADLWFWNDDNAKILELLSRPEVWVCFPEETSETLRFVQAMCRGPFIFRRASAPRLERTEGSDAGPVGRYCHSLMWIRHQLPAGIVGTAVRYHDERNAEHLIMAGHRVEFTHRRRRYRVEASDAIEETTSTQEGNRLVLRHSGDVRFQPRWPGGSVRVGRLSYTYQFDACSMVIDFDVSLEVDPSLAISDVVLSIGHDQLERIGYTQLVVDNAPAPVLDAERDNVRRANADGARFYMIRQGFNSGDAVAIHTLCRGPGLLSQFEAVARERPRGVLAHYSFPGLHRGARLRISEYKLITGGGFYDRITDYMAFITEEVAALPGRRAAYDLSISYDYGVTINAFAKLFASCSSAVLGCVARMQAENIRSLFDEALRHYFDVYVDKHADQPNTLFSRELAFVTLAIVTMFRATEDQGYLRRLRRLCDVLLEFELTFDDGSGEPAAGFLMRQDSPRFAYVDCHSAALLALTQAARCTDDPRLPAAIERGLAAYCLETDRGGGGVLDTVSTLIIDQHEKRNTVNAFWNFQAGMTLRFLAALRNSPVASLQVVATRNRERIDLLDMVLRLQVKRSVTEHADGLEMRCSAFHPETNSETQPWVMLGLVGHPHD